ncbi:MAG: PDZ domain-containing protein, partial [Planctomycetes bacterium]|nr:PDZ domain-containing protein [Planctomycetota bacterium]
MMQGNSWFRGVGGLAAVALVLVLSGAGWAAEPPRAQAFQFAQSEPIQLSDYWLGLACNPASEALRAQLGLAEGEGLVVEEVLADSPAAKAGMKQYDVVVKVDGKSAGKLQELVNAVDAAKEKEVTIELLRGGKPVKIKATPQKRPEMPQAGPPRPEQFSDPNWEMWRKHFDQFRQGEPGGAPWRFRFWGPGTILPPHGKAQPPQAAPHPPLPGNLSVAVTKAGDDPAKVVVKRDDEKWEVTEESLDKLPDDVRPHVERMLGGGVVQPGIDLAPHDFNFVPQQPMPHWGGHPQGSLQPWMDEVNRRMEEIRRAIDEMRG